MNTFHPSDELGRHLIQSVPHKIFEWLASVGVDPDSIEKIGAVDWSSDLDGGSLTFKGITLTWKGHASQPDITGGSHEMFGDPAANLKAFVGFEKDVYLEVEVFVDSLEKHE